MGGAFLLHAKPLQHSGITVSDSNRDRQILGELITCMNAYTLTLTVNYALIE
jgi:hypothetical protein